MSAASNRCWRRCRSKTGFHKQSFHTPEEAEAEVERRGWTARVYPCPHRATRFHITHAEDK